MSLKQVLSTLLVFCIIRASGNQTYGDSKVQAEFEVRCSDTSFVVYFNKTALDERDTANNNRTFSIKFAGATQSACMVDGTSTASIDSDFHPSVVVSNSSFGSRISIGVIYSDNMCGINVFSDKTHIIYNTTIIVTYGKNPNNMIRREEYDYYNVMCLRNRTVKQKIAGDKFDVSYKKDGIDSKNATSGFNFTLSHTDLSDSAQTSYKLGDYIKFTLSLGSTSNVKGVIQNCRATSDGVSNEYKLIDGCTLESGTSWMAPPSDLISIFKTEAFQYNLPNSTAIYVECLVRVCLANDSSSGCNLCIGSRKRRALGNSNNQFERIRRELGSEMESVGQMAMIKSPVFFLVKEDSQKGSGSSEQSSQGLFDGTNGTVIIVLLALLIFVIAVAVLKRFVFTSRSPSAASTISGRENRAFEKV